MSTARLHASERGDRLRLEGQVDFTTARSLWQEGTALLSGDGSVTIDLAGVTRADSAGVALLIHWTRQQRELGGRIEFANIPDQMLALARVSGVDTILPLADD